MATQLLRPIWSAALGRFRNLITGRFISASMAAPFLRAYPAVWGGPGVVIRDVLGHFVPMRLLGGRVLAHFPTGAGNYAAVRREMSVPPSEFLFRSRDVMTGMVHYRIEGGEVQDVWVTMPKGIPFDQAIFEDRFVSRIVERDPETYEIIGPIPEYEVVGVDWAVTTYYQPGAYLGEDIDRFGGVQ